MSSKQRAEEAGTKHIVDLGAGLSVETRSNFFKALKDAARKIERKVAIPAIIAFTLAPIGAGIPLSFYVANNNSQYTAQAEKFIAGQLKEHNKAMESAANYLVVTDKSAFNESSGIFFDKSEGKVVITNTNTAANAIVELMHQSQSNAPAQNLAYSEVYYLAANHGLENSTNSIGAPVVISVSLLVEAGAVIAGTGLIAQKRKKQKEKEEDYWK